MKVYLSTAWIRDNVGLLNSIIDSIDGIEINSIGNSEFSRNIQSYIEENNISVSSIHASSGPHKNSETAYYTPNIASLDEYLRIKDVKELTLTAEWAKEIGTDRIIIHGGYVHSKELKDMFLFYKNYRINGYLSRKSLHRLKIDIKRLREELAPKYVENLTISLNEICTAHPEINFYIETRLHYYEIPLPEEAEYIFKKLNLNNLGYWNDLGHSYIEDRLGLVKFNRWKNRYLLSKCGGLHIHDIDENLKDHYPPGYGNAPLKEMLKEFSKDMPWVLEINSRHTTDEVLTGIKNLKELILDL